MRRSKLIAVTSVLLVTFIAAGLTGCQSSKQEASTNKSVEKSGSTAPSPSSSNNPASSSGLSSQAASSSSSSSQAASGSSTTSSSSSIPQNGLVLYYNFNETSGTSAKDSSPSGKNAKVEGATWGAGKNGNAIIFDGTDDFVELPEGVVSGIKKQFTVAFWVNMNSIAAAQKFFDFSPNSTTENFMKMAPNGTTGKIRFGIKAGSNTKEKVALTPDNSLVTGKWTHIAVTSDGNTGILYVDGVKQAEIADIGIAPADLGITTTNYIGKSATPKDPFLSAKMDEFCIYNRALSADEISKMAK